MRERSLDRAEKGAAVFLALGLGQGVGIGGELAAAGRTPLVYDLSGALGIAVVKVAIPGLEFNQRLL